MNKRRAGAVFCVFAVIFWCMAGALAHVSAVGEALGSLRLWCVKDEDVIANMHWQIYRVGHREENDYVFEGEFADCRATLGDRTKPMTEWDAETAAAAGSTLRMMTIAGNMKSLADGYTDETGTLEFPGLENGLYLVWGNILTVGDTTYIPSAIFFEICGEEQGVLDAYPKIILRTLNNESAQYFVRKVWQNDENQPENRSVSVTVQRYCDEQLYDEIILNEENSWSFSWDDTEGHVWYVHEKEIPENYTAAYLENRTQFLIVNTYEGPEVTVTTATETTTAAETTTTAATTAPPQTTVQTTAPPPPQTTAVTGEKLPQTGQLWWPVPLLTCGGILLLGLGFRLTKKDGEE